MVELIIIMRYRHHRYYFIIIIIIIHVLNYSRLSMFRRCSCAVDRTSAKIGLSLSFNQLVSLEISWYQLISVDASVHVWCVRRRFFNARQKSRRVWPGSRHQKVPSCWGSVGAWVMAVMGNEWIDMNWWLFVWLVNPTGIDMGMDQYLLIPFLMGWTSIYQLFWGSLGTRVLTHPHMTLNDSTW